MTGAESMQKNNRWLIIIYGLILAVYAWWTWILTAPNLILSHWQPYWQWQTWMWSTFYSQRNLITGLFLLLVVALFALFLLIVKKERFLSLKNFALAWVIVITPLLFSFNALSFDVFNYLFNAKMVAVYQANPHQKVALDFSFDPWTRFMHNTHTAAPYGYGWTAISLLPYYLGMEKFTPAWMLSRIFNLLVMVAFLLLVIALQKKVTEKNNWQKIALFFFNPLVLIELISNMHNDLWMMLPALGAIYCLYQTPKDKIKNAWPKISRILASILLLCLSFSIKFATVALMPVFLFLFFDFFKKEKSSWWIKIKPFIFDLAAILMFLPLLTVRSQFFHPWYLLWSLAFMPFIKTKVVKFSLLVLSFSSLLRYIPVLLANGFETYTLLYQQIITFVPLLLYLSFYLGRFLYVQIKKN